MREEEETNVHVRSAGLCTAFKLNSGAKTVDVHEFINVALID